MPTVLGYTNVPIEPFLVFTTKQTFFFFFTRHILKSVHRIQAGHK